MTRKRSSSNSRSGKRQRKFMPVKKKNLFLRERRCIWFRVRKIPERFQKVATAKLLPMLSAVLDQGYKKEQKRGIAIQILHHLATTEGEAVADSRDNSKQIGFRSEIWDEIVRLELAIQCKGSKQDGFITRYMATEKLLTLFKEWKYSDLHNTETERNTEMKQPTWDAPVVLTQRRADKKKGKKKELIPFPKNETIHMFLNGSFPHGGDEVPTRECLMMFEHQVERINEANIMEHTWTLRKPVLCSDGKSHLTTLQPNIQLQLQYSGALLDWGRLYTRGPYSIQGLPKRARKRILIDGEKVAELDFSSFHIRLLYHTNGIDIRGDAYRPQRIFPKFYETDPASRDTDVVRQFVKRATNICLTADSRAEAVRAIARMLNNPNGKMKPSHQSLLQDVLLSENLSPLKVIQRLEKLHVPVQHHFFRKVGATLQTCDGQLMIQILTDLTVNMGIPAMGIHDGVLCKRKDVNKVKEVMMFRYVANFRFPPLIQREY